jgi:hypothetical protein
VEDNLERLERAYAAGDHRTARSLARTLRADPSPDTQARAQKVLRETDVDWFLPIVGLLGLGLTAWLVYNYWQ